MNATITIPDPNRKLPLIFEAELKQTINERASYTVNEKDGVTTFQVEANDITALRATLNAIMKQLAVYDKMQKL